MSTVRSTVTQQQIIIIDAFYHRKTRGAGSGELDWLLRYRNEPLLVTLHAAAPYVSSSIFEGGQQCNANTLFLFLSTTRTWASALPACSCLSARRFTEIKRTLLLVSCRSRQPPASFDVHAAVLYQAAAASFPFRIGRFHYPTTPYVHPLPLPPVPTESPPSMCEQYAVSI